VSFVVIHCVVCLGYRNCHSVRRHRAAARECRMFSRERRIAYSDRHQASGKNAHGPLRSCNAPCFWRLASRVPFRNSRLPTISAASFTNVRR